ncbi:uncharacterized protein ASCRUDRAFT_8974 [Ascoidea rubescens DSM 1968]|uniref:Extracellular membrane protein CFEM domain-containing protein n=1 Tax=Ascoidea rubescens DSM 1968 TaxID=1344418 RepID=A0A1D2VEZ2_9ASCO|nr:hypothetical protein ASCRUDRAFT_8974 [Ascoidea rubescens DSM 1968]ODV60221.1 hypothetical protein ASCRUDRAFT_8974 [Ascoidea rubescens DSM 1968]
MKLLSSLIPLSLASASVLASSPIAALHLSKRDCPTSDACVEFPNLTEQANCTIPDDYTTQEFIDYSVCLCGLENDFWEVYYLCGFCVDSVDDDTIEETKVQYCQAIGLDVSSNSTSTSNSTSDSTSNSTIASDSISDSSSSSESSSRSVSITSSSSSSSSNEDVEIAQETDTSTVTSTNSESSTDGAASFSVFQSFNVVLFSISTILLGLL